MHCNEFVAPARITKCLRHQMTLTDVVIPTGR
jgi:hypothetical protein